LSILRIDGEVRSRAYLGRREAAFRFEIGAVERQGSVVIGEAKRHPIGPHDPPAPGERGRALVEMGLKCGRERFHFRPQPRHRATEASAEEITPPAVPVRA
jgi:hypothetical protein